jgi:hypothetical protein
VKGAVSPCRGEKGEISSPMTFNLWKGARRMLQGLGHHAGRVIALLARALWAGPASRRISAVVAVALLVVLARGSADGVFAKTATLVLVTASLLALYGTVIRGR